MSSFDKQGWRLSSAGDFETPGAIEQGSEAVVILCFGSDQILPVIIGAKELSDIIAGRWRC